MALPCAGTPRDREIRNRRKEKRKVLVLVCALALALGGFAPAEAQEEDAALYQSELGYAIALPDETWFKLDAQTYAQYADTELGAAFAGLGLTEETVGLSEGSNMEYFYTSAAPEQRATARTATSCTRRSCT